MKRDKHKLSHYKLLTCDFGQLVPLTCVPVLPGDSFQHSVSMLIRLSPQLAPIMHPVVARVHTFYAPLRILWNTKLGDSGDFEDFITGGPDGFDDQVVPKLTTNFDGRPYDDNILNYLGIPKVDGLEISSLPMRMYKAVWNEYYRDQDLDDELDITNDQSQALRPCAWGRDYFTQARPFAQKGPDITIPLGTNAPIYGLGKSTQQFDASNVTVNESRGINRNYASAAQIATGGSGQIEDNERFYVEEDSNFPGHPRLYADLQNATSSTVNAWRKAFALQRYQEARARYGSRFTEFLRYLGVTPSDARLQRPEYLGGGKQTITFSEVLQTVDDETGQERGPLGKMGGHGIAAMRTNRYRKFFEEHGYVMSFLSIRPFGMYTDGIHREFLRTDKEDFWQRELETIGQQEVFNNEIHADPAAGHETFGYSDRYQEYKGHPSSVCGEFRDLLDYWHLARKFETPPALNTEFIRCNPSKRIFAEQTQNSVWAMVNHSIQARRLLKRSPSSRIL